MASSLRGTPTGEPRHGDAVSKAPQSCRLLNAPLDHVDVPVPIGIEHGERRLEARRYQEVLQVFVAAVDEELNHFLVALDSLDAAGGSGGKRRVASMAYEPPQTLRTARTAADATTRAG